MNFRAWLSCQPWLEPLSLVSSKDAATPTPGARAAQASLGPEASPGAPCGSPGLRRVLSQEGMEAGGTGEPSADVLPWGRDAGRECSPRAKRSRSRSPSPDVATGRCQAAQALKACFRGASDEGGCKATPGMPPVQWLLAGTAWLDATVYPSPAQSLALTPSLEAEAAQARTRHLLAFLPGTGTCTRHHGSNGAVPCALVDGAASEDFLLPLRVAARQPLQVGRTCQHTGKDVDEEETDVLVLDFASHGVFCLRPDAVSGANVTTQDSPQGECEVGATVTLFLPGVSLNVWSPFSTNGLHGEEASARLCAELEDMQGYADPLEQGREGLVCLAGQVGLQTWSRKCLDLAAVALAACEAADGDPHVLNSLLLKAVKLSSHS